MAKIVNWTTEAKLAAMATKGWREIGRRRVEAEGRTVVELSHSGRKVVTFRSLPL